MSAAKTQILDRVRRAVGNPSPDVPITRQYTQAGTLDESARLALFSSRLEDYNAGVYRCTESELPATIAQILAARGKRRLVIPPALPAAWLPAGLEFVRDAAFTHDEIDAFEGAITACTAAIAMTGSIILRHSDREGRRALTLIPDYHLCIVRADQVVETVPEGIRALRDFRTRPITTIAGPSATADIEMTRIKGVHGPRTLDVIITGGVD